MAEVGEPQITPETPGRPAILNPFESPNDYHRLHEPFVPSPSIFRSSCASATPAKFKWSIDEMSNLLPVEIDPEDINRQSFYLSQTRTDSEIEQKRQYAIEQFFTKGAIVPSPWAAPASTQKHHGKGYFSHITDEPEPSRKTNATCQTILSLPVDFDLEKVLGGHFKVEEVSEQVQDTLSSSSLRRKLFLDGHGSGSDSSNPPSPERGPYVANPSGKEAMSPSLMSPLQCDVPIQTSSTGQFSSSPIQGRFRNYSMGSVTSPMFPDRSSPTFKSPTLSPIGLQQAETPLSGERKCLTFLTPEGIPLSSSDMEVRCRGDGPYVEGCSPIRSCSPLRPRHRARVWGSPIHLSPISPILSTIRQSADPPHHAMELDCSSPRTEVALPGHIVSPQPASELMEQEEDTRESARQGDTVDATDRCGKEQLDCGWTKELQEEVEDKEEEEEEEEEGGNSLSVPKRLTSSWTGSLSKGESLHMFTSLLAEGSLIPTDGSMQVDSGYNTYWTGTTSLMEGISCDSQSKEVLDAHIPEEGQLYTKFMKSKIVLPHH
ncbi:protein aurora borealis [Clupea harengus]|uniref:Protein aurora borealis n=1 Tax=Clupea harengus TaxID=7950 RepID=A0A6P3WDP4_CLUHA|nr:protein aurora borealis [Clupea harengus]XP_031414866.1 protein aurora borealis [Clupea harengus]